MRSRTKSRLDEATIRELVRANLGPGARLERITELTEGMFNAAYILSVADDGAGTRRDLVLKSGIREGTHILTYEQEIMRAEVHVYDLLAPTPVPVPAVVARDFSHALVPCDYFFMERVPGDHWGRAERRIPPLAERELQRCLGGAAAHMHQVQGPYFGYIKDEASFHHDTWRGAFTAMVEAIVADGRRDRVRLPYDRVLAALDPLLPLLEEIEAPRLVNFDMWRKNIMVDDASGAWRITGIVDHERAFFGDPYAEFVSVAMICGDIAEAEAFRAGYCEASGREFTWTPRDRARDRMYRTYLYLLMCVEIYRYTPPTALAMYSVCRGLLLREVRRLEASVKERAAGL